MWCTSWVRYSRAQFDLYQVVFDRFDCDGLLPSLRKKRCRTVANCGELVGSGEIEISELRKSGAWFLVMRAQVCNYLPLVRLKQLIRLGCFSASASWLCGR